MDRILSDNIGFDAQGRRIFKNGPPATTVDDSWCNGIQEELMSVIESEGFAGNFSDNTLLLKAISAAITRAVSQATDNYVVVHDLGTKNIVSANSGFDLDQYISGGALAKPSGYKFLLAASDGTGSFYCSPSTSYSINGVSALNYRFYGTGKYTVQLDNTNSNWIICEPDDYVWDKITAVSGAFTQVCERKVKNEMVTQIKHSGAFTCNDAYGSLFYDNAAYISSQTFVLGFSAVPILESMACYNVAGSNGVDIWVTGGSALSSADSMTCSPIRHQSTAVLTYYSTQTYKGTYR